MKYPHKITEERTIHRITFKQSMYDLLNAFNIERGLIYTLKLLFIRPGEAITLYLQEGRYRIFNAFRLLIITTAISLFIMYLAGIDDMLLGFKGDVGQELDSSAKEFGQSQEELNRLLQQTFFDWYNLFLWISIPVFAFFSYLFFMKINLNYAEHLVIQSFHISALNVITMVLFPIHYLFGLDVMFSLVLLTSTAYFLFFAAHIFHAKNILSYLKFLLLYIISNVIYMTVAALILGIIIGYKSEMFLNPPG